MRGAGRSVRSHCYGHRDAGDGRPGARYESEGHSATRRNLVHIGLHGGGSSKPQLPPSGRCLSGEAVYSRTSHAARAPGARCTRKWKRVMMISDYAQLARLLVVDDEETNRRLLDRILRSAGYCNVRTLGDSREVESVVEEYEPDLLLLDLHIPYLDGFAVLEHLAPYLTGASYLPVLMLTGDSTTEAKRGALSLGARDFVPKPFDATEVLLRIRNMLESRFLHRELESQNT